MATLRDARDSGRRLTGELMLVAALSWVANVLPPGGVASTGWDLMAPVLAFCGHALLGIWLLIEAGLLLVRWSAGLAVLPALPVVGAAAVLTAVIAGAARSPAQGTTACGSRW